MSNEVIGQLMIIGFVVLAMWGAVKVTWRLLQPPTREEVYWRFIPNWTSERIRHLHVIDPEMHELAKRAAHTLLTQERERHSRQG